MRSPVEARRPHHDSSERVSPEIPRRIALANRRKELWLEFKCKKAHAQFSGRRRSAVDRSPRGPTSRASSNGDLQAPEQGRTQGKPRQVGSERTEKAEWMRARERR